LYHCRPVLAAASFNKGFAMHLLPGVLMRRDPAAAPAPLVFDIPRSGTWYPREFRPTAGFDAVHQGVSMYVDELYQGVVDAGATWLFALFPNSYIDANRHEADIDPALLDGEWPGVLQTTDKSRLGIGLIHSKCGPTGLPMYSGKLSIADVQERIDGYYWPYHHELARLLAEHRARAGIAYHVSCHSMASVGGASTVDHGSPRSDFDIGTRHGVSCEPEFAELVLTTLRGFGYQVTSNFHYAGAESVAKHAAPERGIHSLQIELKRGLYMNEKTFARNEGFAKVQADLGKLAATLADYARSRSSN
jgi:N-formylglutamate amidohydrolase